MDQSCSVRSQEERWGSAVFMPSKRKRSELNNMSMNGATEDGQNGAGALFSFQTPARKHSGFVRIDGQKGVYYSENWKPNGSTLYLPVSGSVLANMDKYDQISFEQGCFGLGDETGRFQQKAQGQTIHCWRYSKMDRKLVITLSYFFTNFQVFQEVLDFFDCL
ncbi:uncharacterized protein si:dkey-109l4.3 [Hoplias malabaricus]|uniref:uncharacterized protein si:dkey-109l4.3 n=1 Tax=Hoplias malabaricus TaxID=27720 RepID=UPI003462CAF0